MIYDHLKIGKCITNILDFTRIRPTIICKLIFLFLSSFFFFFKYFISILPPPPNVSFASVVIVTSECKVTPQWRFRVITQSLMNQIFQLLISNKLWKKKKINKSLFCCISFSSHLVKHRVALAQVDFYWMELLAPCTTMQFWIQSCPSQADFLEPSQPCCFIYSFRLGEETDSAFFSKSTSRNVTGMSQLEFTLVLLF